MRIAAVTASVVFAQVFASTVLYAAEVVSPSRIDQVTVFLSGAEVTRMAKVTLDKGEHVIVFKDVPASAISGSIRVDGAATGKLDISSVDTARKYLAKAESLAADEERKKLEAQIEELRNAMTLEEAKVQASDLQKDLMKALSQMPTRPVNGGTTGDEDWRRILTIIADGTTDASKLQVEAQAKVRELGQKIEDLDRKLSELAPAKTDQTEVRVHVIAESPLDADFTIRYQVKNANWAPLYDARLQTGSKTAAAKLELARRAAITQRSGESWDDVILQLSTARPSVGASAPDLATQTVDFEPEVRPAPPVPLAKTRRMSEPSVEMGEMAAADAASPSEIALAAAAPEPQAMSTLEAALTTSPFEATFAVPGRVSVAGNGDAKRVVLVTEELEPKLSSRTVPKADTNAYLYVTLNLPKGTPLLPGRVFLFRDGTFAGTSSVPLLQPGEDHDLGFGVDDQVKVRYTVLEEKRGSSGLISSLHVDSRNYRVSVKNLHERPIQVMVLDRVPVSQNDEIKVEYTGQNKPTETDFKGQRGIIGFDMKLEKDEEQQLEYGYRTSWPAAKSIIYGP